MSKKYREGNIVRKIVTIFGFGLLLAINFNISLASDDETLKLDGLKPFAGVMIGTTTDSGMTSTTSGYGYNYLPLFQTGLFGGFEYNFEEFGIRIYGNLLSSLLGSISSTSTSVSTTRMVFSGNLDVIYRPTKAVGVFIGFGLGDTLLGLTERSTSNTATVTENYFTTMGNFGVQYNLNYHSFLELSAIANIMWVFKSATEPLLSPTTKVSYSILAKYAYRF